MLYHFQIIRITKEIHVAEYEFLLTFSPSLSAELSAIYELFFSYVVYSKPR